MQWKGKNVVLFLNGDLEFLGKMYGLSGSASRHPCGFCQISKEEMQPKREHQNKKVMKRSLFNLKLDHTVFEGHGSKKEKAKDCYNVVGTPIWNIDISNVCPPYLHLLLGIVKKHHDNLLDDCHQIDKQIADCLSNEEHICERVSEKISPTYRHIVKHMQKLKKAGRKVSYEQFEFLPHEGPVVSAVEKVLQKHKIQRQAFHGGALVGNHCHKYVQNKQVIADLTSAISHTAFSLSDNSDVHTLADSLETRCRELITRYSTVHSLVSHGDAITQDNVEEHFRSIEQAITEYMDYFRDNVTLHTTAGKFLKKVEKVTPKQHILEAHCVPWMEKWRFGLGFHGEQALEAMHATMNRLNRRAHGIRNQGDRLAMLMTEQLVQSSPAIINTPKKTKSAGSKQIT
jgi:biotin operon repressor